MSTFANRRSDAALPSRRELLDEAHGRIGDRREGALLLAQTLSLEEASMRAWPERRVAAAAAEQFRALLARRADGEPVAYLLGEREFWGRSFAVDDRVLVPRPETEHLVEAALERLVDDAAPRILDVGTGSGCLAVTLACEIPTARIVASDLSAGALAVATANARRHGVGERVLAVRADLARGLPLGAFDLVVSNPPYVAPDASLPRDVAGYEPHQALFAAEGGRAALRRLLDAAAFLRAGAHLLLEIGHDQGAWLRAAAAARPHLGLVELIRDYGGHERTAVLRRR
ncbi:MAG: peptide chain release factor N(5)-glutamine methyltransferase [Acidobacteriota bacterium]